MTNDYLCFRKRGFEHFGRHWPRVENDEIGQFREFILRSLAEDQRHGPRLWVNDDSWLTHIRGSTFRLTNIVTNYSREIRIVTGITATPTGSRRWEDRAGERAMSIS